MTAIEKRTEKIAAYLAKERGFPEAMREMFLGEAYNLVYFGDKKRLKEIEDAIKLVEAPAKKRRRK